MLELSGRSGAPHRMDATVTVCLVFTTEIVALLQRDVHAVSERQC